MTDREFAEAFGGLLQDGLIDVDQADEYTAPRFRPTPLCHLALEFERRNPAAGNAHADEAETIAAAPPSAEDGVSPSVRSTPAA